MEDVLEIYERPLNSSEPVVCLDEKPVALHAEVRPPRPPKPGHVAKCDSEYERRGTANVFCAVEPKAGRHFSWPTPDRCADRFAIALFELAISYPDAKTIHLIMDNLSTHSRKSLVGLYGEEFGGMIWDRLTVHYTPKHGSWAESSRDRDQPLRSAMSRQATDREPPRTQRRGPRVEPSDQQEDGHQLDIHTQ